MFYNYYESDEYQYNSCVVRGLCSIDPMVASLQEVIIMYLKQLAFYMLKLHKIGISNQVITDNIINTLSNLVSNTEYSQDQFKNIITILYKDLYEAKTLYESVCNKKNISPETFKSDLKIYSKFSLVKAIQQGEKEYIRKTKFISFLKRQLYEVVFLLAKSVCINLLELKNYEENYTNSYIQILELLNLMNFNNVSANDLKQEIEKFSLINYSIITRINEFKIKEFGEIEETTVSFSTRPGKAILVSGSSYKELRDVLEATKNKNIDVYTHGSMIFAHIYPAFKKYPHLIGQFGMGVENCLLDFATFPGAILMTKNSLQNVEHLYRGRLFTTDFNPPKGVVHIQNKNYLPLIKSALDAKGFNKGQKRESLTINFLEENINKKVEKILQAFEHDKFKHLAIVSSFNQNFSQKKYFDEFLKINVPEVFFLNLSENIPQNNFQTNSYYDFVFMFKLLNKLKQTEVAKKFDISVFLTKCDKFTLPNILTLRTFGVKNIFLASCLLTNINPGTIETFKKEFDINSFTIPKDELDIILK